MQSASDLLMGTEKMTRQVELLEGVLSRRRLAELRQHESRSGTAVSLYADIDTRRWAGAEAARIAAKNTLLALRRRVDASKELDPQQRRTVLTDVERIQLLVEATVGRRGTRGLAVFADYASRFALAIPLPWPVRARWFIGKRFVLWPLEQLLHLSETYCICLTDKDDARIFLAYMGAIEERKDLVDEIPGKIRYPDPFRELEYMRKHVEYFHKHFERTAQALFELYQHEPFDHLIVGGLHEVLPQFERHLHSYLREKLIARWDVPVQRITLNEVLERVRVEEQKIEQAHCERIWAQIERQGPGRSTRGPEHVLEALWQHRVHALLLDPALRLDANKCSNCGRSTLKARCPVCGNSSLDTVDAVTEATLLAIETGALVKFWTGSAELAAAGHMATLNRY